MTQTMRNAAMALAANERRSCSTPNCHGRPAGSNVALCSGCQTATRAADPTWPRCAIDDCESPAFRLRHGLCLMHNGRRQRTGDPLAAPKRGRAAWLDHVGYYPAHQRVVRERGPAHTHPCVDCGKPARHWSYEDGDPAEILWEERGLRYSLDLAYYSPRCVRCHWDRDVAIRRGRCDRARAADWLADYLRQRGGSALTADVYPAAAAAGINRSVLYDAALKRLKVTSEPLNQEGSKPGRRKQGRRWTLVTAEALEEVVGGEAA
jgi:hypothetical protein